MNDLHGVACVIDDGTDSIFCQQNGEIEYAYSLKWEDVELDNNNQGDQLY